LEKKTPGLDSAFSANIPVESESRSRWKREGVRFAKFLVVGTIGAVVDFGTFNLLTAVAHLWPIPSQGISFLAAVCSNFIFNRYWTYPDSRSKPVRRQALQFTAINAVGLCIRTPLFAVLIPVWQSALVGLKIGTPESLVQPARNLSLACAVFVVLIWNFVINRLWTYNDVR
jgi:putative flippase GtrA